MSKKAIKISYKFRRMTKNSKRMIENSLKLDIKEKKPSKENK